VVLEVVRSGADPVVTLSLLNSREQKQRVHPEQSSGPGPREGAPGSRSWG
jgi:hypothetical protein